jgi:hypothetical protein
MNKNMLKHLEFGCEQFLYLFFVLGVFVTKLEWIDSHRPTRGDDKCGHFTTCSELRSHLLNHCYSLLTYVYGTIIK